jgi:hypothetical protein
MRKRANDQGVPRDMIPSSGRNLVWSITGETLQQNPKGKLATPVRSHIQLLSTEISRKFQTGTNRSPEEQTAVANNTVNCTKSCFMSDGSQARISSMIVPVWMHHNDNPETEKLVYALLDDQSDTTFITQSSTKFSIHETTRGI